MSPSRGTALPVIVLNPNGVSPRSPGLATLEPTLGEARSGGSNPKGVASLQCRNPIRRGLIDEVTHWKWSSARWYASDKVVVDLDLPTIHGLPPEFFD